jgi:hypothetical protein
MTVNVANNYNIRKLIQPFSKSKNDKKLNSTVRINKQQIRNKIDEEEDDETMIG